MPSIFHIATLAELRWGIRDNEYAPRRFQEDGFVHCAESAETVLAVAHDYFAAAVGDVVVLQIEPARLTSKLVFEAAAPIAGGGIAHLQKAQVWPHVYGPINLPAIDGVGVLMRVAAEFEWPQRFGPIGLFA